VLGSAPLTVSSSLIVLVAATFAGALNSVAGGGSFISFPALLFTGVPPVAANATNAVALWPAGVASAFAYRKEMRQSRAHMIALSTASFVGGGVGAILLLMTNDTTFVKLIPYLLLLATAVFTFGGMVAKKLRARAASHKSGEGEKGDGSIALGWGTVVQLVISLYGGYFGGGMGIMMLATFSLMGMTDMHAMNGLKTLLGTMINGVAVLAFIVAGAVAWGPGVIMVVGGTLGGYVGAAFARKMDPIWVRRFVLVIAWGMTVYFFFKY
jgi:uncharacterized membrane protein YfcA